MKILTIIPFGVLGIGSVSTVAYYSLKEKDIYKFKNLKNKMKNFSKEFENLFNEIKLKIKSSSKQEEFKKLWLHYFIMLYKNSSLNLDENKKMKIILKKISEKENSIIEKNKNVKELSDEFLKDVKELKKEFENQNQEMNLFNDIFEKIKKIGNMIFKKSSIENSLEQQQKILISEEFKKLKKILKNDKEFEKLQNIQTTISKNNEEILKNNFLYSSENAIKNDNPMIMEEIKNLKQNGENILENKKFRSIYKKIKNIFDELIKMHENKINLSNLARNNFYIEFLKIVDIEIS